MRGVVLAMLAGCGRIAFDPTVSDGGGSGSGDRDGAALDGPGTSGLVAFWRCDDDLSDGPVDSMAGHNGTCLAGQCPVAVAGMRGSACNFDGIDDVVTVLDAPVFRAQTFTIAFWFRFASDTGVGDFIAKRLAASDLSWAWFRSSATIQLQFYVNTINNSGSGCFMDQAVGGTTWFHAAGTYTGGEMRFYVNGQSITTCAAPASVMFDGGPIMIGGDPVQGLHNGALDEIRIYDRVLAPGEITELLSL